MPSTSEVGHAKNVANFGDLITYCTAYGTTYNPPKPALQLASLNNLLATAKAELATVATSKNVFDTVTGDRQAIFENLKSLSTRIINFLPVTEATAQTVADAQTINNLIQGRRSSTTPEPTTNEDGTPQNKTVSTSRQSYDMLTENFSSLIDLVSSIPTYTPNEAELTVASLNDYLQQLQTANTSVTGAEVTYSNARIARDKTLYADKIGLVDVALDVKKYVKAIFGATTAEFNQVSGIKFTKRND